MLIEVADQCGGLPPGGEQTIRDVPGTGCVFTPRFPRQPLPSPTPPPFAE